MIYAKSETVERLYRESLKIHAVDARTHIQDDIAGFDLAKKNLARTQASFNRCPEHVIEKSIKQKYLIRRLMTDATHGLFYSWFAQAMLEALDEIGREIKDSGEEYGSCLQVALGVTYFMDMSREIQSFPVYRFEPFKGSSFAFCQGEA